MKHLKASKAPKKSPLFTSEAAKVRKAEVIKAFGRDKDGAYRTRNRIDGNS